MPEINKKLIAVINSGNYERSLDPDEEKDNFQSLIENFGDLFKEAEFLPCTDFDELKSVIAGNNVLPAVVLVDVENINLVKIANKFAKKYPRVKVVLLPIKSVSHSPGEVIVFSSFKFSQEGDILQAYNFLRR